MLLEKRSSLKAKLLSFDDSFLQSPRNLQSTAALPLPAVLKEDEEGLVPDALDPRNPSVSSLSPSNSTPLFPTLSIPMLPPPTKTRRRKDPEMPAAQPMPPPPPAHFEMPMFDPSWTHHPVWPHDVYHQTYPAVQHYPSGYVHPEVPVSHVDYATWHQNGM